MIPDDNLELEGNQFAFKMFSKALHCILRLDEGIAIEHENQMYIVSKFKDEETGDELVGIDVNPESDGPLEHGMMVWMDLDKPPEERHKDDE
jgi:hypothetical protein